MKPQDLQYEQQISLLEFWRKFVYYENNGADASNGERKQKLWN